MTARARLPDRRPNLTRSIAWQGREIVVTAGFDPASGVLREVFAAGAKEGSDMAMVLADACVVISLALQFGARPGDLAHSLGRVPAWGADGAEGEAPASAIGAVVEALVQLVAAEGG